MRRRTHKLAPSTEALYARTLKRAFGDKVPDYAPDLESPSPWPETVRSVLCAAILNYWERRDPRKGEDIVAAIPPGEYVERVKLFPSRDEVSRFAAVLPQLPAHVCAAFRVMLGLGPRTEEILTMPRIEAERGLSTDRIVLDGKGNKRRELPSVKAKEALRALLSARTSDGTTWKTPGELFGGSGTVFSTRRNALAVHVGRAALRAGLTDGSGPSLGWTPHRLRHIFATRMTEAGAPEPVVAYALGHAPSTVTRAYVHVSPDQLVPYMPDA